MATKKSVPSDIPIPATPPPIYRIHSDSDINQTRLLTEKDKVKQPKLDSPCSYPSIREHPLHPTLPSPLPSPPAGKFNWTELILAHPTPVKISSLQHKLRKPLPFSLVDLKGIAEHRPKGNSEPKDFHTPPITPPHTPPTPPDPEPSPSPSPSPPSPSPKSAAELRSRQSQAKVTQQPHTRVPTPLPLPPIWATLPWWFKKAKMAAPPRMLILSGGGYEAFVAMPPSYEKAITLATEKFNIPATHVVRLSCKASDMQWIGGYAGSEDIFIADNDSFHYACAGKHVARLGVHVYDKNAKPGPAPAPTSGGPPPAAGGGGGEKKEEKKETKAPAPPPAADQTLTCQTTAGKNVTLNAKVTGELTKGIPAGNYLGTLTIEDKTWKQTFVGNQLGPNEVMTKYVVHDKNTARLLFRPRSIRPSVNFLHPEEKSLEVSLSILDWTVTSAYPITSLLPDGSRQKLRWFLKVQPGGIVEDMLTGTMSSGLYMEMIPTAKAKPDKAPGPEDPLIPAHPDIRPSNAWCLPQSIFIPHLDRILTAIGLPVESRTAMITAWLPGLTRHKNIAYRILNRAQLEPTSKLTIIPPPDVMLRIFVIFKGIPDSEMKDWENAGVLHAEMGLDWRDSVGWTPDMQNESLFRVIEYGAM
ncbi:uncharacterized protein IL334_002769 [Kwoniella shivajii]|uniref:Uncharacterized protein n=1 Tax=Kwoniella shivajii TaxID=564305 RepID=A0ABZ1CW01_9TREE|nr:hypothetical protein IL334_002769 [Kwoniella shivajii]